jgi:hypothetical protein
MNAGAGYSDSAGSATNPGSKFLLPGRSVRQLPGTCFRSFHDYQAYLLLMNKVNLHEIYCFYLAKKLMKIPSYNHAKSASNLSILLAA